MKPKNLIVVERINHDQKSASARAWVKKHRFHLLVVNPDDNVLVIVCFEKVGDSVDVVDEACHRLPRSHRGPEADDVCDRGHVDLDACTNAVDKAGYADAGESWTRPVTLKSGKLTLTATSIFHSGNHQHKS